MGKSNKPKTISTTARTGGTVPQQEPEIKKEDSVAEQSQQLSEETVVETTDSSVEQKDDGVETEATVIEGESSQETAAVETAQTEVPLTASAPLLEIPQVEETPVVEEVQESPLELALKAAASQLATYIKGMSPNVAVSPSDISARQINLFWLYNQLLNRDDDPTFRGLILLLDGFEKEAKGALGESYLFRGINEAFPDSRQATFFRRFGAFLQALRNPASRRFVARQQNVQMLVEVAPTPFAAQRIVEFFNGLTSAD